MVLNAQCTHTHIHFTIFISYPFSTASFLFLLLCAQNPLYSNPKIRVVMQWYCTIFWVMCGYEWRWNTIIHVWALQKTYWNEGKCTTKDVLVLSFFCWVFSSSCKRNTQFHMSNIYSAFGLNVEYHNSSKPHPYPLNRRFVTKSTIRCEFESSIQHHRIMFIYWKKRSNVFILRKYKSLEYSSHNSVDVKHRTNWHVRIHRIGCLAFWQLECCKIAWKYKWPKTESKGSSIRWLWIEKPLLSKSIWVWIVAVVESDSLCHLLKWSAFIMWTYLEWIRPNELLKRFSISQSPSLSVGFFF